MVEKNGESTVRTTVLCILPWSLVASQSAKSSEESRPPISESGPDANVGRLFFVFVFWKFG